MNIGDVSQRLGMPASTIRFYEKEGLIEHQPRISGRRNFNDQALVALQFVQLAQAAGFSIAETKSLLENHKQDPSCKGLWMPLVEKKQANIKQQINDLQQMDRILDALRGCECTSIKQCVGASMQRSCIDSQVVSSA